MLIQSGIYLEFDPKTQTELTDLYTAIKFRNTKLEELGHYHEAFFMNDTSDERKNRWKDERIIFEIAITDHEKFIKEQLNSVEKLMDEEMS